MINSKGTGRRKPTALKLIAGNPGKRPLNAREAKLAAARPSPPTFLNDEAKVEWERVVGTLSAAGLMTEVDRGILAAYCQSYGLWEKAEVELAQMTLTVETGGGNIIQNPLLGIANKARTDMHKHAAELGMTPASRSKVQALPDDGAKDPADEFFG